MPADQRTGDDAPGGSPRRPGTSAHRRRHFLRLLAWNVLSGIALAALLAAVLASPLGRPRALLIGTAFAALMVFMGGILAAYFAFLRTGG
ncbi:MAG: hypothetical protein DWQ36_09875 [Acidobacteria bacterium]|nr:MAG: hypothetical protein DWQ30_01155 [Acidobacteriota bacterium]REK08367.1 MAG: hypothetical protein DWQ36_09875 [Acidobacteriota bacterium]